MSKRKVAAAKAGGNAASISPVDAPDGNSTVKLPKVANEPALYYSAADETYIKTLSAVTQESIQLKRHEALAELIKADKESLPSQPRKRTKFFHAAFKNHRAALQDQGITDFTVGGQAESAALSEDGMSEQKYVSKELVDAAHGVGAGTGAPAALTKATGPELKPGLGPGLGLGLEPGLGLKPGLDPTAKQHIVGGTVVLSTLTPKGRGYSSLGAAVSVYRLITKSPMQVVDVLNGVIIEGSALAAGIVKIHDRDEKEISVEVNSAVVQEAAKAAAEAYLQAGPLECDDLSAYSMKEVEKLSKEINYKKKIGPFEKRLNSYSAGNKFPSTADISTEALSLPTLLAPLLASNDASVNVWILSPEDSLTLTLSHKVIGPKSTNDGTVVDVAQDDNGDYSLMEQQKMQHVVFVTDLNPSSKHDMEEISSMVSSGIFQDTSVIIVDISSCSGFGQNEGVLEARMPVANRPFCSTSGNAVIPSIKVCDLSFYDYDSKMDPTDVRSKLVSSTIPTVVVFDLNSVILMQEEAPKFIEAMLSAQSDISVVIPNLVVLDQLDATNLNIERVTLDTGLNASIFYDVKNGVDRSLLRQKVMEISAVDKQLPMAVITPFKLEVKFKSRFRFE
jgi:hypothetical protein